MGAGHGGARRNDLGSLEKVMLVVSREDGLKKGKRGDELGSCYDLRGGGDNADLGLRWCRGRR